MLTGVNRSTRRKTCPRVTFLTTNLEEEKRCKLITAMLILATLLEEIQTRNSLEEAFFSVAIKMVCMV
jgi:hypothetical protein